MKRLDILRETAEVFKNVQPWGWIRFLSKHRPQF